MDRNHLSTSTTKTIIIESTINKTNSPNHSNSNHNHNHNNQLETNGTNDLNNESNDESNDESNNESNDELNEESEVSSLNISVPEIAVPHHGHHGHQRFDNRLGCSSPLVLEHMDEAIESVVNNFQLSKSDLLDAPSPTLTTNNHQNKSTTNGKTRPVKSKTKRKKKKPTSNYHSFDIDLPFELNSKKKKSDTQTANKRSKDNLVGPYIKVEKKKNQLNYLVINSQSKQDDKETKFFKDNRTNISLSLVNRTKQLYKNDNSWFCIFCKRSPHFKKLGDLFGPYELDLNKPDKTANPEANALPSTSNGTNNDNKTTEIWFHEDCIIWSNDIYLAGNRLRNLEEVIRDCTDVTCSECKLKGANLGCVQKGCNQTFHYICAKTSDCELDEQNFSMFCQSHKRTNSNENS